MTMTIDEAIESEIKQAKCYKQDVQIMINMGVVETAITNIEKIAERHEQIAYLLEELKALREEKQNKCKDCAGCTMWKCDCSNIRNKAIDDFATEIKNLISGSYVLRCRDIEEIAEQLKEGGDNENSN